MMHACRLPEQSMRRPSGTLCRRDGGPGRGHGGGPVRRVWPRCPAMREVRERSSWPPPVSRRPSFRRPSAKRSVATSEIRSTSAWPTSPPEGLRSTVPPISQAREQVGADRLSHLAVSYPAWCALAGRLAGYLRRRSVLVWRVQRLADRRSARSYLAGRLRVIPEDSTTFLIRFSAPSPEQLYDATYHVRVVPEHVWSGVPVAEWAGDTSVEG